jgi:hypothetical protein
MVLKWLDEKPNVIAKYNPRVPSCEVWVLDENGEKIGELIGGQVVFTIHDLQDPDAEEQP